MMKKYIALATLCFAPLAAGQYVGLDVGTNDTTITNANGSEPKIGLKMGARYGYAFDSGLRAEFHLTQIGRASCRERV